MTPKDEHAGLNQQAKQSQAQRQRLSPYQRLALQVLALGAPALNDLIASTAEVNPLLEVDWGAQPFSPLTASWDVKEEADTLLCDLRLEYHVACKDPALLKAGDYLINHLDKDGYLRLPLTKAAAQLGIALDQVKSALDVLQALDPPGVGARNLREFLFLQLKQEPRPSRLALVIVKDFLSQLAAGDLASIAAALGQPLESVARAAARIRALRPRPFHGLGEGTVRYTTPEISVEVIQGEPSVSLIPRTPTLRIMPYEAMLADDAAALKWAVGVAGEARQLAEAIKRREQTLLAIGNQIAKVQRGFFMGGYPLAPLTQGDIAQALSLSISTISRAVKGQYLIFNNKVYPLSHFFQTHVPAGASRAQLCALISAVIRGEQPSHPVTDGQMARLLASLGQAVSRRLITKYRQSLGIPKAADRKR